MSRLENILSHLPDWLKMKQDETALGYKFIESFGLSLEEIEDVFGDLEKNLSINGADTSIPDVVYEVALDLDGENYFILSDMTVSKTVSEFFGATDETIIYDTGKNTVYINNISDPFATVVINVYSPKRDYVGEIMYDEEGSLMQGDYVCTISKVPSVHNVWNCFDEFGFMVGVRRYLGETNESFKTRVINFMISEPGSNSESVKSSIANQLGVTPDSIEICNMNDVEKYDDNDNVSNAFMNYILLLKKQQEYLNLKWDKTISDITMTNIDYVPRLYNDILSQIDEKYIQSGIGDADDLKTFLPQTDAYNQDFTAELALTGEIKNITKFYPQHSFGFMAEATGTKLGNILKPKEVLYSVAASKSITTQGEVTASSS